MKTTEPINPERKLVKTKSYKITLEIFDDKTVKLTRQTINFNVMEILGLLDITRVDLLHQLNGESELAKPNGIQPEEVDEYSMKKEMDINLESKDDSIEGELK